MMEQSFSPRHFSPLSATLSEQNYDIFSRQAREQIARQVATSAASRRQYQHHQQQYGRVYKPGSTGNSPQNFSRRRQGVSMRPYSQSVDIQQAMRRRAATTATQRPDVDVAEARPVSWHSAILTPRDQIQVRHSTYEAQPLSYGSYGAYGMTGLPTPLSQDGDLFSSTSLDQSFSLESSPLFPQQSYSHIPISADWSTNPCDNVSSTTSQLLTPASQPFSTPDLYSSTGSQFSFSAYQHQQFAADSFNVVPDVHTAPPTPNDAPLIAKSDDKATDADEHEDGPELIGMGLYDSQPTGLLFNSKSPASSLNRPKSLKLCDAWTPPDETQSEDGDADDDDNDNENEDNEDNDANDDDVNDREDETDGPSAERDEVDDEPEPSEDCSPPTPVDRLPHMADLSNKSFYFDDSAETNGSMPLTGLQTNLGGNWASLMNQSTGWGKW